MQIRQLVTILGICLSQVHAMVPSEADQTAKSIVTLITAPHEALEANVPGLTAKKANLIRESPYLYANQLRAGILETGSSLLYVGVGPAQAHTPLIRRSLLGYSLTLAEDLPRDVKTRRLAIYRDSLYSRISDLAKQLGPDWTEGKQRGTVAIKNLKAELGQVLLEFEKVHMAPAGNEEALEKMRVETQRFVDTHKGFLEKLSQWERHIKAQLPNNFNLPPMKYLDVQQVEAALQETNQGEHFKALPVNILPHEHPAPAKLSAAPSHHANTLPAPQVPASRPMVAAAA